MKFKLFRSMVVLAPNAAGGYDVAGGTDNLELQVNKWLTAHPGIQVASTTVSTSQMAAGDGSLARETVLALIYGDAELEQGRTLPDPGKLPGPLRLV